MGSVACLAVHISSQQYQYKQSSSMGDTRERNQQLLDDWELRMRGAPDDPEGSGWAYNWDSAKCSTSQPTARSDDQGYSYATMFMTTNRTDDPVYDFKVFFHDLSQLTAFRAVEKKFLVIADNGPPLERGKRAVTVITNQSDEVLLRGSIRLTMVENLRETPIPDFMRTSMLLQK